jgi:hypothetical protein
MSRIIPSLTSPLSYAELGPMFATPADHKTTGIFMEAYSGARSEVRVRHKIVEVRYLDFKSQYSLVNGLLCNQDLLLASGLKVVIDDADTIQFLEELNAGDLFKRDTWPKLRGIVRIDPAGCM